MVGRDMQVLTGWTILALIASLLAPLPAQSDGSVVTVEGGSVRGAIAGDVLAFKGIPYAASPVGRLRWRAPQPVAPWSGVRDATAFCGDCMQVPFGSSAGPLRTKPSEDCLAVNLWRPATIRAGKALPILVWIHGGGGVNGGSSAPVYDGSAFAREGLLFVSLNHRLGRFGFFEHPALTAAAEGPACNFGYLDQVAALNWVRKNGASFGGDVNQVTVFGESAGGVAVLHLLTSPAGRGLFHRAIVMSGGGRTSLNFPVIRDTPAAVGTAFARGEGIEGAGIEALAALRALPAAKVCGGLNFGTLMMMGAKAAETYAGPGYDGWTVSADPVVALRHRRAANVPLMIGTTSRDAAVTFPESRDDPLSFFGGEAAAARAAYDPEKKLKAHDLFVAVGEDLSMQEPARFVAKQMTASGNPVWLYRFGYVVESAQPKVAAAQHASELPFAFDTLAARYGDAVTDRDRAAARAFHGYVAQFAKSGDPNASGRPAWSRFDPGRGELMTFTADRGPAMEADPRKARLDLVERALDSFDGSQAGLAGSTWQLVRIQEGGRIPVVPDDPAKYVFTFEADGKLSARIDCNRGRSTWKITSRDTIQLGPLETTAMKCPSGSLERIAADWTDLSTWAIRQGRLLLTRGSTGALYEFEHVPVPK
jgi:para-nitrobenzyl esterase